MVHQTHTLYSCHSIYSKTRGIWGDAVEFRCTSYEVHSSYMNAAGHNDKGAGREIDKFLPSSELAHRLDDIIELM